MDTDLGDFVDLIDGDGVFVIWVIVYAFVVCIEDILQGESCDGDDEGEAEFVFVGLVLLFYILELGVFEGIESCGRLFIL